MEKRKKEGEKIILNLENQIKAKEENLAELSNQIEKLKKDMTALEGCNKEAGLSHKKELSKAKEEFESVLEKKEKVISIITLVVFHICC